MNSIRYRVLIALVCAGFIPSVVLLLVTNSVTGKAIERAQYEKIHDVGAEVSRQVISSMEAAATGMKTLKTNPLIVRPEVSMKDRFAEMARIVNEDPRFEDITLYAEEGWMIKSTTPDTPEAEENTSWFEEAVETGEVVTSLPHRVTGIPGLHLKVYIPIELQGVPGTSVLMARLPFDTVWDRIGGAKVGKLGKFVLLDSFGKTLFYPNDQNSADEAMCLEAFDESIPAGIWPNGNQGVYTVPGESEPSIFVSHAIAAADTQVKEPWTLLAFLPISEVNAAVRRSQGYQYAIGIVTIVIGGICGLIWSKQLAEPVVQASTAARRVAAGNLNLKIPVAGALEMRQLATSFNSMIDEVRNHQSQLESLVESRTEKLMDSQKNLENTFAQLRASYEAAKDGVLVVGIDGSIIAANELVIEYFGLSGKVEGMDAQAFLQQAERCFSNGVGFRQVWETVSAQGGKLAEGEWELISPEERVLSVYSAAVQAGGQQIARLWTFQDVTERHTLQRGLEQAQKMEAVGRLAGGVAHDFNNALTGIIGNLSLVELGDGRIEGKAQADYIEKAKSAGQRAAVLVKQLLGFSRRSHLELDYCDVNRVIDDVYGLLSSTFDPRVVIEADAGDDLWSVEVDATQVEQVVMNLCVNARDAMDETGGRIELRTANTTLAESDVRSNHSKGNAGDYVLLTVSDNGSGIPDELMGKIFDPFFTTKEQGKGTGLGLATSYGIVEQHGGWIECDSELGKGTTFSIYLPRKDRPADQTGIAKQDDNEPVRGGEETILIVDDDVAVRAVAQGVLKHHGYKILTAGDGEEALEIYSDHADEISLVLLDLTMPKLSGRETLAALREGYGAVPVVVCSGYLVDLEGFEFETGYRPDAAVQKPYKVKDLARKVREVIDESNAALCA